MSRFHRVCMLVQTVSLAIIALFFLLVMIVWLVLWLVVGAFATGATAVTGAVSADAPSAEFDSDKALEDIRKAGARRALGIAPNPSSGALAPSPPVPSLDAPFRKMFRDSEEQMRRAEEQRRFESLRREEEKARREALPNGPRQK